MKKRLKSILKKRPKIHRESKKGITKRKVFFKEEKNQEKIYHLTKIESYEKKITWYKILRSSNKYFN